MPFNIERFLNDPSRPKTVMLAIRLRNPVTDLDEYFFAANRFCYYVPDVFGLTERVIWNGCLSKINFELDAIKIRDNFLKGHVVRSNFGDFDIEDIDGKISSLSNSDIREAYWYLGDNKQSDISTFIRRSINFKKIKRLDSRRFRLETTDTLEQADTRFCKVKETNPVYDPWGLDKTRPVSYGLIVYAKPLHIYNDPANINYFRFDSFRCGLDFGAFLYDRVGQLNVSGYSFFSNRTGVNINDNNLTAGEIRGGVNSLFVLYYGRTKLDVNATAASDIFLTAGEILEDVYLRDGITLNASDVSQLNTDLIFYMQLYERSARYTNNVVNDFIENLSIFIWDDFGSDVRIKQLYDPNGSEPVDYFITDNHIYSDGIKVDESLEPIYDIEVETTLVQGDGLQNEVVNVSTLISSKSRKRTASDNTVLDDYSNAGTITLSTPIYDDDDGQLFADSQLLLFKEKRNFYKIICTIGVFSITLFNKINVTSVLDESLITGRNMIVLSIKYDIDNNIVTLIAWG